MGEINISLEERSSLEAVDTNVLNKLIEQCLYDERSDALQILRLETCGPYAASQLREFERTLAAYSKAKATKKRANTQDRARRAGSDLANAIQQMKHRMETEKEEATLFHVDDQIAPPYHFSKRVSVRVNYRWRRRIEDEWTYDSITFTHDADLRSDYSTPLPKRKLSVARQERERQDKFYRKWEQLMKLGLHSVRDYFREGGDGAAIPQSFEAKVDPHTQALNNHSAKFWLQNS